MTAATPDAQDPVALLQALIRCASVTPHEGGALALLEEILKPLGFACHRIAFGGDDGTARVENLYARLGTAAPHLCFAGHTDVVPPGDVAGWTQDPFGGVIANGEIYGRGAADMKGPIACFVAALARRLAEKPLAGSVSFLITGDEEGPAVNGTVKVLQWLAERGEKIDFCLVGEPTSSAKLGDMMKIGRRGTLSGYLTVRGVQGHVAYPARADNPIPKMLALLNALEALHLDDGSRHFQPSNLEIVTVDTGNPADNVIPAQCRANFNVRFNDHYTGKTLMDKIRAALEASGVKQEDYDIDFRLGGESFYTEPAREADLLADCIESVTGLRPDPSTTGGTSDARFIRKYAPVIEFGITGTHMHKTDERVSVAEMQALTDIYRRFIDGWFAR